MTARKKPSPTLTTLTVVVLTVVAWWIFLGRDVVREVDPATGNVTGPYEAPQVIACVLVLAALVVVGTLSAPAWAAVLAVAVPFTAAWTIQAQATDDSGLWAVGALLVLLGTLAGGAVVAVVTRVVERRRAARSMTAQ
jgi:O-antigen ligase